MFLILSSFIHNFTIKMHNEIEFSDDIDFKDTISEWYNI